MHLHFAHVFYKHHQITLKSVGQETKPFKERGLNWTLKNERCKERQKIWPWPWK